MRKQFVYERFSTYEFKLLYSPSFNCMEVKINQKNYQLESSGGKELMSGNVVSGPRGGNVVSTPSSLWPSNSPLHSNAKAVTTSVTSSMISNTVTIL